MKDTPCKKGEGVTKTCEIHMRMTDLPLLAQMKMNTIQDFHQMRIHLLANSSGDCPMVSSLPGSNLSWLTPSVSC